ncbi:ABC transporter permease [Zeimonas arvi]|uniref:ABC transporter permease n=1 Tax=Zeimonas arvi TaxID=2498847 RepID=A0A5C8P506_9BURK|nr:FtsX-like permease family protein [Zeimonas arvi]TXL68403.1 ABC transporter permease [Zeimonas arvi]
MPFNALLRIALRNLMRQVRHSAFALAAIVFGVAGLALADGFIRDVFFQLGEATVRGQLGHLQVARPGFRESGAGRPEAFVIERTEAIRSALRGDSRIESVAGRLQVSGVINVENRELPVEVEGVEPTPEAVDGTYLTLLDGVGLDRGGAHAALLGEGVARHLGVRRGDYVTLTSATVDGSMNAVELEVAGVFRTFSKEFDDRTIRIPLADAQELVQVAGVNTIVIHLRRTDDTGAVLADLVGRSQLRGLDLQPWYILSDFYASTRELYARQFGILRLIALVLIAMSVLTSTNITVFERTAEFGTMRALGAESRTVVKLLALESAALGFAGALLGVAVAIVAGMLISWIGIPMPPPPNAEAGFTARVLLSPVALLGAAGVGVASSVIGGCLPSFRAARLPIVYALGKRV